jgi:hypothetical protein
MGAYGTLLESSPANKENTVSPPTTLNDHMRSPFEMMARYVTHGKGKDSLAGTPKPDLPRETSTANLTFSRLLEMAYYYEGQCSPFSTIVTNLVNYTFRNGFHWEPRFTSKCLECGREWNDTVDECSCGSSQFREPDPEQQGHFAHFNGTSYLDRANDSRMSLLDVCKLTERHRTVADNAYWVMTKSYLFNGDDVHSVVKGVIPVDPRDMVKVYDRHGRLDENRRTCLIHRAETDRLRCRICDKPTFPIAYQTRTGNDMLYTEDEVIHSSEYNPGMIYGYPEILRAADVSNAIINIDYRVRDYYENVHLPAIIGVTSPNQDTLTTNVRKLVEAKEENPNLPSFLSLGDNGSMEMVKLMEDPNNEMWELRRRMVLDIASKFNFPAMMLNDMTDAGGLNVESEQQAMWGQKIEQVRTHFEQSHLTPLLAHFPTITDWNLRIAREDDEDTLAEMEVMLKQAEVMRILSDIGFDVTYKNREIAVSDTIVHDRTPQPVEVMRESNYGDLDDNRKPLIDFEDEWDFITSIANRQYLQDSPELTLNLALAADYVKDVIKSIAPDKVEDLYRILIDEMSKPEGWSINNIIGRVQDAFNLDYYKAETIARTESRRVANISREQDTIANDPPDAIYDWVGANDHRTTRVCKAIKDRIKQEGKGVPLQRLKQIVREEGMRYASPGFRMIDDWTPHINCRHTYRRVYD